MSAQTEEIRALAADIVAGTAIVNADSLIASALRSAADKIDELFAVIVALQDLGNAASVIADDRADAANRYLERARAAEKLAADRKDAMLAAAALAGHLVKEVRP